MVSVRAVLIVVILFTSVQVSLGSTGKPSVLLLPLNMNSHTYMFGRLAAALIKEGHPVTMVTASTMAMPEWLLSSAVTVLNYKDNGVESLASSNKSSEIMLRAALSQSMLEFISTMIEMVQMMQSSCGQDCDMMMGDRDLQRHLEETRYDFVVIDAIAASCQVTLPYKYGIPYATFGLPAMQHLHRVPALPSFVPSFSFNFADSMSFKERLINGIATCLLDPLLQNKTSYFLDTYIPEKKVDPAELWYGTALWFYLRDDLLSYPMPSMPDTVSIGDVMISPPQSLPLDLQQFMDESYEGVILVSLGSFINYIPQYISDKFCEAFKQVKLRVIIKHRDQDLCPGVGNLKVMTWTPQNDLLAHPNLKLFITHGGFNSLMETLYHAVPVLVIPISLDQPYNAKIVETKGYGQVLSLKTFTAKSLTCAIVDLLENKTIKDNIKVASAMLQDRLDTPGQRASYWICHVIKYGSQHLKTAAVNLNIFQFFMFDIFLFILVVLTCSATGFVISSCFCLKYIYRRAIKSKEKSE